MKKILLLTAGVLLLSTFAQGGKKRLLERDVEVPAAKEARIMPRRPEDQLIMACINGRLDEVRNLVERDHVAVDCWSGECSPASLEALQQLAAFPEKMAQDLVDTCIQANDGRDSEAGCVLPVDLWREVIAKYVGENTEECCALCRDPYYEGIVHAGNQRLSPLLCALYCRHHEIARFLLEHGAKPRAVVDILNRQSKIVFAGFHIPSKPECCTLLARGVQRGILSDVQVLQVFLREVGCDGNEPCIYDLFREACAMPHVSAEVVKLLVKNRALNCVRKFPCCVGRRISLALDAHNFDIVRLLTGDEFAFPPMPEEYCTCGASLYDCRSGENNPFAIHCATPERAAWMIIANVKLSDAQIEDFRKRFGTEFVTQCVARKGTDFSPAEFENLLALSNS